MASRFLTPVALRASGRATMARLFQTSARRMDGVLSAGTTATPVRRPVGAFRGGFIGFLLGSTVAAYGTYSWILKEYRLSNDLLTEDIYALQAAVQRVHTYVASLEEKVDALSKKQ